MKRIFLILAAILILLTGCNNSTELSDTPTESTPAIVITETVTTPTTENEDPKGTTDNADAASSFSASNETVTTEPEETISETKPTVTTEQPTQTEKKETTSTTPTETKPSVTDTEPQENEPKDTEPPITTEEPVIIPEVKRPSASEIEAKTAEYINQYRLAQGDTQTVILPRLTAVAEYRAKQLTVKETVFPTNYHAYGKTEWTVTVNANNDGLVTINAVNEVDNGSAKIVKTSEDGIVEGVTFRLKGNGVDMTVTTNANGEVQIDDLKPGTYTVTETVFDKYEPQETRNVVVVSNQVATVTFNNVLKRGDLEVIKTSEDNLVEGVQFHLYGTSLSGLAVDEYAVTDKNGVATFKDVLISGHESYTLEEVDTAERYIVPDSQRTASDNERKTTLRCFGRL